MSDLTKRNVEILKIIVEEFLQTGNVLGSNALLKKYDLGVSSATVRNDMATLESIELIYQPYNSAGRLPTAKGLRVFINYLMKEMPSHFITDENLNIKSGSIKTLEDFIYNITSELAKKTGEISFLTLEGNGILEYSGISKFLENNQKNLGDSILNIIKILEDKHNFIRFVSTLPLNPGVNVFVGEENIINFLKDYTIIVKRIFIDKKIGYIGLIGGLKMNYSFNISAVRGII